MFNRRRRYYKPFLKRPPNRRATARQLWRSPRPAIINRPPIKTLVLAVFFTASLIWFLYFFLASDNFFITTVNIAGAQTIPEESIRGIVNETLGKRRNLILFSKKRMLKNLTDKYIFESIEIDRDWPATINIIIKEKQARLLWRSLTTATESAGETATSTASVITRTSYYYLDVNGIVVSEAQNIGENELGSLPVIESKAESQTLVKPGEQAISSEQIEYVLAVYNGLSKSGANIKLSYAELNPAVGDELRVKTTEGWQIAFTRKLALDSQIKKLELTLLQKIRDKRSSLEYVDLRVKDRVYYK